MQQERPDFNTELLGGHNAFPWIDNIIGEDDGHVDLDHLKNDGSSAEFATRQQVSPPQYALLLDNSQGANVDAGRNGSCKYHETLDFDSYRSPPTASCQHTDSLQAFSPASCTSDTPNHQVEMLIRHGTDHIATTCASAIACPCNWQADFMHNGAGDRLQRFDTVMSAQSPSCWVDKAAVTAWLPADHRELLYRTAAMQPVAFSGIGDNIVSPAAGIKPRRNIRISKDPQSVAARQRRRRISEKIRVLQGLVPGGAKLDTAEMLEEAAQYVKFLKAEVEKMEAMEDWMSLKAAAGPNFIDMHVAASHQSPPSICLSGIKRL